MRRALIVANSELPPREILEPLLSDADRIIAADGGANRLLAIGWEPHAVVGDMDSVLGSTRRLLPRAKFVLRKNPNHTDLEKALEYAVGSGCTHATVVGATVGRLDHVLAATMALLEWSGRLRLQFVDADFTTELVRRSIRFRAPKGTLVSLFAPREARGVTTRGLRWELRRKTLRPSTLGIHNYVARSPASVSVEAGELLLMRGHYVLPHA